jgi:poly(A) polymerase
VPAALVPVLELSLAGVAVDLAYVPLPADALVEAAVFAPDELPASWLASHRDALDTPAQLTLLGAADADALLAVARATCGEARLRELVSFLTGWARARAIHGNAYGYLGSFSWSVLAAWAAQTFPDPASSPSLFQLLTHLFTTLAAWDFHRPIALAGTADSYEPTRRREPLVLLAPAPPVRNTARNVLRGTLTVLRHEMVLARDALARTSASSAHRTLEAAGSERLALTDLLRPFAPPPPSPTATTLALSFICEPGERTTCLGWLDSQALSLLIELERHYRIRPHLPCPPHARPSSDEPALRIHLQSSSSSPAGPLDHRPALAAAQHLADQFRAWPERPGTSALRLAID